jgi:SIR2-like domain
LENGLSVGVRPDFAVDALTVRLNESLDEPTREALAEIAVLGRPDSFSAPSADTPLGFEDYAGPIDRIASAVRTLAPLAEGSERAEVLWDAYEYLRLRYVQLVGLVLAEVVRAAHLAESARWEALNAFADEIWAIHNRVPSAVFTLSYDTLLESAMIEAHRGWFYDGFAGMTLNHPLDCFPGTLPVYHLHGSALWYETPDGTIRKVRSDNPDHERLMEEWQEGRASLGLPVVVLTDLKTRAVGQYPFDILYAELWTELSEANTVVTAGYGFRDVPVNAVLRAWLNGARDDTPRALEVWSPHADLTRTAAGRALSLTDEQLHALVAVDVTLPDPAPLAALEGRVHRRGAMSPS